MSEASSVSIPVPRPELLAEIWPADSDARPRGREKTGDRRPAARPAAVLRRVRKRAKLLPRRSMPLLGGTLLAVFLAAGA